MASGSATQHMLADNPRLEISCFSTGRLELNPQKHVWKATQQSVSHNHLVPPLPQLAEQFETHLTTTTFGSLFLEHYGYITIRSMFI